MARETWVCPRPARCPWRVQVASQPALESIPLILEPDSQFYASPVVVLDFRSLYPSIIIGYPSHLGCAASLYTVCCILYAVHSM